MGQWPPSASHLPTGQDLVFLRPSKLDQVHPLDLGLRSSIPVLGLCPLKIQLPRRDSELLHAKLNGERPTGCPMRAAWPSPHRQQTLLLPHVGSLFQWLSFRTQGSLPRGSQVKGEALRLAPAGTRWGRAALAGPTDPTALLRQVLTTCCAATGQPTPIRGRGAKLQSQASPHK